MVFASYFGKPRIFMLLRATPDERFRLHEESGITVSHQCLSHDVDWGY
jgi:hypothetical protein